MFAVKVISCLWVNFRFTDIHVSHLSSGGTGVPGHARESVQFNSSRMFDAQRMPLGIGSCAWRN
jgi:hypothetical protein